MILKKVTLLLVVDAIEPVIPFWESQLGYKREAEVPHEAALGFVLLKHETTGGEIMLQTRASLAADLPAIAARSPEVVLYIDVGSLSEALAETRGAEVLVPRRTTFYGAHEAAILDPSGKIVIFAEHG